MYYVDNFSNALLPVSTQALLVLAELQLHSVTDYCEPECQGWPGRKVRETEISRIFQQIIIDFSRLFQVISTQITCQKSDQITEFAISILV